MKTIAHQTITTSFPPTPPISVRDGMILITIGDGITRDSTGGIHGIIRDSTGGMLGTIPSGDMDLADRGGIPP